MIVALVVLGLVVVCGVIMLEVSVTVRSRGAVIDAREEAEDWRTVAMNLGALIDATVVADCGLDESRLARVTQQLNACREAYPR